MLISHILRDILAITGMVTNKKATISGGQSFLFESEPQVKLLFNCFSKFWNLLCLEKLGLKH